MSEQFLGEIRMFGGNFAPMDWMFCNGQLLNISEYSALYALIGTTYGGNGTTNFALPDLRCRLAVGEGQGPGLTARTIGTVDGQETVTLTQQQMPAHNHIATATTAAGNLTGPAATAVTAAPAGTGSFLYAIPGSVPVTTVAMAPQSITSAGGNQSHGNLMPSLCVSFIIAVTGIFPSRN